MSAVLQHCPRCGGLLGRRLNELECQSCGYFVHTDFAAQPEAAGQAAHADVVWHAPKASLLATAAAADGGKFLRQQALSRHKLVFLISFAVLFLLSSAMLMRQQAAAPTAVQVRTVLVLCVALTALFAAPLYAEWPALKVVATVSAWLLSTACLVLAVLNWEPALPLQVLPPLIMSVVYGWLALLLHADTRELRR
jgi:hypothetical protein